MPFDAIDQSSRLDQGRTAEVFPWSANTVLKLFHTGVGGFVGEALAAQAAHASGVNTPRPLAVVEVHGRPGIVYERVQGAPLMASFKSKPHGIPAMARAFADLHASIHRADGAGMRSGHAWLERRIASAELLSASQRQTMLAELERMPRGDRLCHGDFHPANVLLTPRGFVAIDWANAFQGDPLADVGQTALILRFAAVPPEMLRGIRVTFELFRRLFLTIYLRRYFRVTGASPSALECWQAPLAAARLSETIPGEEKRLKELVTK